MTTHHSHDAHKRPAGQTVTRFAPSPTGFMHVGGVRTALFAWLFARKHGQHGTFILRSEDTDKEREVEGSMAHIIESLSWLGLDWNEGPDIGGPYGPYTQSERLDTYKKYARILIDKGLAYADPYTQEELEAFRKKAEEEKRPFLYRDHRPADDKLSPWNDTDERDAEGKPLRKALRLRIPDEMIAAGTVRWNDLVRGELSAGPESLDDFILIKSDGYPTYNFAHIIDDLLMGVTHITRADEFISSTPKFLALYDALGIKENPTAEEIAAGMHARPQMASLPPIMSPDGKKKLGKRDGAKDILEYRSEGYLPEAMMNFLAFIGWNPGDEREIMSASEIMEAFDFAKVQSAGGKLNEEKLVWTNREYLVRMSDTEWLSRFLTWLESPYAFAQDTRKALEDRGIKIEGEKFMDILTKVCRERISYFGEIKAMAENGELDYYFFAPLDNPEATDLGAEEERAFRELIICPEKMRKNGAGEKIEVDAASTVAILNQIGEILEKHTQGESANDVDAQNAATGGWTKEGIKEAIWPFAEHEGRGVALWPLRVALSGAERSPDPFVLASILGKKETLDRVRAAVLVLEK